MKANFLLISFLSIVLAGSAQDGWTPTGIAPDTRYDDIFFINDSTGWTAGGYNGQILHTTNRGESWQVQFTGTKYLRSIEFATPTLGFCGSLNGSLYKTTNGGLSWTDIAPTISPKPAGICGLAAPDATHIYGCGIWSEPAFIIRSSDAGTNWTYTDMSALASRLVDIFFLNKDTGFVSGTAYPSTDGGIILGTTDGGISWSVKLRTFSSEDYIWKLQTPDSTHFFGSIQSLPGNNNTRMIRSQDRGNTWEVKTIKNTYFNTEMVGFIDKDRGWIGGLQSLFKSTDGGETWSANLVNDSRNFNRFFRLSPTLAYLSGRRIYKHVFDPPPAPPGTVDSLPEHTIVVSPNPVTGTARIELNFIGNTFASLQLFTTEGKKLNNLLHQQVDRGKRSIDMDMRAYPAGVYFLVLRTNEVFTDRKIIKR